MKDEVISLQPRKTFKRGNVEVVVRRSWAASLHCTHAIVPWHLDLVPGQNGEISAQSAVRLEAFAHMEKRRDSVDIMPWQSAIEMLLDWD